MSRGLRFVSVGAGGFVVHAATLQGLVSLAGLPYPVATALAVEASILHNFLWHERWTWADRVQPDPIPRRLRREGPQPREPRWRGSSASTASRRSCRSAATSR